MTVARSNGQFVGLVDLEALSNAATRPAGHWAGGWRRCIVGEGFDDEDHVRVETVEALGGVLPVDGGADDGPRLREGESTTSPLRRDVVPQTYSSKPETGGQLSARLAAQVRPTSHGGDHHAAHSHGYPSDSCLRGGGD